MIDVERVFEHWATHETFSNNEIYNLKGTAQAYATWCHPDIWQTWGSPTKVSNFLAEKNYLHDLETQIGITEGDAAPHGNGPWIFRNNVFANINSCYFDGSWKLYWYNNTFYRTSLFCDHPIRAAAAGSDNLDVRNNVFVGSGTGNSNGWYVFNSGTADYNFVSNLTNGAKSGFSEKNGINGGNPMFVNAQTDCIKNECDFHLAANSVLIDKGTVITGVSADGTAIPAFSTDKDGNPRTGKWDMGAYEFGSGASNIIISPSYLRGTVNP
jgi:hypothetical protein